MICSRQTGAFVLVCQRISVAGIASGALWQADNRQPEDPVENNVYGQDMHLDKSITVW